MIRKPAGSFKPRYFGVIGYLTRKRDFLEKFDSNRFHISLYNSNPIALSDSC